MLLLEDLDLCELLGHLGRVREANLVHLLLGLVGGFALLLFGLLNQARALVVLGLQLVLIL
eukprot:175511-Pleurochrysis_carterae.AAC.1